MRRITTDHMIRISRTEAFKRFRLGFVTILTPSNLSPRSKWGGGVRICATDAENMTYVHDLKTFQKIENEFKYYNCNTVSGKRIFFYKPINENIERYWLENEDVLETHRINDVEYVFVERDGQDGRRKVRNITAYVMSGGIEPVYFDMQNDSIKMLEGHLQFTKTECNQLKKIAARLYERVVKK